MNQLEAIVYSLKTGDSYFCENEERKMIKGRLYRRVKASDLWVPDPVDSFFAKATVYEAYVSSPLETDAFKRRTMENVR